MKSLFLSTLSLLFHVFISIDVLYFQLFILLSDFIIYWLVIYYNFFIEYYFSSYLSLSSYAPLSPRRSFWAPSSQFLYPSSKFHYLYVSSFQFFLFLSAIDLSHYILLVINSPRFQVELLSLGFPLRSAFGIPSCLIILDCKAIQSSIYSI